MDARGVEFANLSKVKHEARLSCFQQFLHLAKEGVTFGRIQDLRQLSHNHFMLGLLRGIPVWSMMLVVTVQVEYLSRLAGPRSSDWIPLAIIPHERLLSASGDAIPISWRRTFGCRNALFSCLRIGLIA